MWEAIKVILSSDNSIQVLIFSLLIVIIVVLLIKGNFLKIHTPFVTLNGNEQERTILRQQMEFTYNYVSGLYGIIKAKYPSFDELKTKYILEKIYDEVIIWISFNHITRSEMYIMVKSEKLRCMICSMNVHEFIKSDDFSVLIKRWTKEIINRLVDIREYYSK